MRLLLAVAFAVGACVAVPTPAPTRPGLPAATPPASLESGAPTGSPQPDDVPPASREWRWTQETLADPAARSVNAIWVLPTASVAVDTPGYETSRASAFRALTSGSTWASVDFPKPGFAVEQGLLRDGRLTVIGRVGPAADPRRQIWVTRDGLVWTQVEGTTGLDFGAGATDDLVHGDAGWLALGREWLDPESATQHVLFSSDGRTWIEIDGPPGGLDGLVSDGRQFTSIAPFAQDAPLGGMPHPLEALVSDDGRHWVRVGVGGLARGEGASALAATGSAFAIGGRRFEPKDESSHPIGWASVDGVSWTPSEFRDMAGPAGEAAPIAILASDDGFIAHGNGDPLADALWLSDDGSVWTQVTPLPVLGQVDAFARAGRDVIVAGLSSSDGSVEIWRGTQLP